ncbi:MAG TPA: hypothetical protein VF152_06790 [Acidimicrobiia bacterium]
MALTVIASLATVTAAHAQSGDSSASGDVAGNLPAAIYLLIPLALALAFVTAVALGDRGEPDPGEHRSGGLTRALGRRGPDGEGRPVQEREVS